MEWEKMQLTYQQLQKMEMHQEQSLIMTWKQDPLAQMQGYNVFRNLTVYREHSTKEPESLSEEYKGIRKMAMVEPYNKVIPIIAASRAGTAKGSFLMGFRWLLQNDIFLIDWAEKNSVNLNVVTVPFVLYTRAVNLDKIAETKPQFYVEKGLPQGLHQVEDYAKISRLMWSDIDEDILSDRKPNETTFLLTEASGHASYPLTEDVPVTISGTDRGNSVGYNLAYDQRTRDFVKFYVIKREHAVAEHISKWRSGIDPQNLNPDVVFKGDVQVFYTDDKGNKVDVSTLSEEQQMQILLFAKDAMAPINAIKRSDMEFEEIKKELYRSGKIKEKDTFEGISDKAFFKFLKRKLKLNRHHFSVLLNTWLGEIRDYDLDYLFDSLPARKYPELLPSFIREIQQKKMEQERKAA